MFKNYIKLSTFTLLVLATSCGSEEKVESAVEQTIEEAVAVVSSTYSNLQEGSMLDWRATHLGGVAPRSGKIYCKDASVTVENGAVVNAKVKIEMGSLTVENMTEEETADLSGHLKSADFFNVTEHPHADFTTTSINVSTEDYNSEITGDLTIMGVTNSVTFKANIGVSDQMVNVVSETFTIDRSDWNMVYNAEGTEGVPLDYIIADDIELKISFGAGK